MASGASSVKAATENQSAILTGLQVLRRYKYVILFPVLTIWAISADYNHTQKYKALKALQQEKPAK